VPTDAEITFADHMGRFYARRYAFPPMVGRLIGYLAVCDPPEQSIGDLADALLASRSASGITDRFRTMSIARAAVLGGHVLATLIQVAISLAIVLGVAVALGFRPTADALHWLAAIGVLMLFALALIWLATALGLAAKSVETASNTPMFLTLLPFLSSGFVPTASMPAGLRQFAEYEPFTPVTQTVRGLLTGGPIGTHAIAAVPWCIGIALASYLWAVRLYNRRRAATPN
jgi:ABC-2 type transport system permease protein